MHCQRSCAISDLEDVLTRHLYCLVVFGKHLKNSGSFVSVSNFSFIAFQGALGNIYCLTYRLPVFELPIKLVENEPSLFLMDCLVFMALVYQIKGSIYYLMSLDCHVAVLLSQQIQVWANAESDEKLFLENSSDFSKTASERTVLNRLDNCVHSD